MSIQWRRQLSVDNGRIDRDHKALIEIVNRFENEFSLQSAKFVLHELKKYTELHFETEEKLQRAIAYPFAEAHAKAHRQLSRDLEKISDHYSAAVDNKSISAARSEMVGLLHDWLINHIIKEDLLMCPYGKRLRDKQE